MSKKQYIPMFIVAIIAGFLGGALSNRFMTLDRVETQKDLGAKNVVVANEFHLVDDDGKDRWVLKLSGEGEPNITFINKNGWAPMAIGVNRKGFPFFNMVLEPRKNGGPSFVLMDSQMKNRALLGLRRDGEPYLSLLDKNGQVRAALGSIDLKNPITGLNEKRPCSSLVLFDQDGKVIWSTPELIPLTVKLSKNRRLSKKGALRK